MSPRAILNKIIDFDLAYDTSAAKVGLLHSDLSVLVSSWNQIESLPHTVTQTPVFVISVRGFSAVA